MINNVWGKNSCRVLNVLSPREQSNVSSNNVCITDSPNIVCSTSTVGDEVYGNVGIRTHVFLFWVLDG